MTNGMDISLRKERTDDIEAIDQLNREAFNSTDEPKLVKLLRGRDELLVSLVAVGDAKIVGHVCASPVKVDGHDYSIAGIGPLAVNESHRKQGIGAMLMEETIKLLRDGGFIAAVVLGSPKYYPRFGFSPGAEFGLQNEYYAGDSFMVMELQPNSLDPVSGMARYVSAFAECGA